MLDVSKTHWVVFQGCHFTGNEYPKERRKTRKGAFKAMKSLEQWLDSDEYYCYVIRNDRPTEKWY